VEGKKCLPYPMQSLTGYTAKPNTHLSRERGCTFRRGWKLTDHIYYTLHCVLIICAESVCDVPTRCLRRPYDLHHLMVLQPVVPGNRIRELDARQLGRFQSEGRQKEREGESFNEMGEEKSMGGKVHGSAEEMDGDEHRHHQRMATHRVCVYMLQGVPVSLKQFLLLLRRQHNVFCNRCDSVHVRGCAQKIRFTFSNGWQWGVFRAHIGSTVVLRIFHRRRRCCRFHKNAAKNMKRSRKKEGR
jgi:hypothetical protein